MKKLIALVFIISIFKCANAASVKLNQITDDKLHEIWDEEVPIMGHLAVATDGSVLVFKERRDQKLIEVKRSEDAGKTWSDPIMVGRRVKIDGDMSDDGRFSLDWLMEEYQKKD